MIQYEDMLIYFAGDTAYAEHFSEIKKLFPRISIALLPIAPAEPRTHMHVSHLGPEEAGQAFLDLEARCFIPMHWGTFGFGTDQPEAPIERLQQWWVNNQQHLKTAELKVIKAYEMCDVFGFYQKLHLDSLFVRKERFFDQ